MSEALSREDGGVRLSGPLDRDSAGDLLASLRQAMSGGDVRQIDLAQVERVDSAGLALVLEALALARAGGQTVRLRGMPAQMAAIARACGVAELLGEF